MHNLSAAQSMGVYLAAFIAPHCLEKRLRLIATPCDSAKSPWNFAVGRLRCSKIAPRFRHVWV